MPAWPSPTLCPARREYVPLAQHAHARCSVDTNTSPSGNTRLWLQNDENWGYDPLAPNMEPAPSKLQDSGHVTREDGAIVTLPASTRSTCSGDSNRRQ